METIPAAATTASAATSGAARAGAPPVHPQGVAGVKKYARTANGFRVEVVLMTMNKRKRLEAALAGLGVPPVLLLSWTWLDRLHAPPAAMGVLVVVTFAALCTWGWRRLTERFVVDFGADQVLIGSKALPRADFEGFAIVRQFKMRSRHHGDAIDMAEVGFVHRGHAESMGMKKLKAARTLVACLNAWAQDAAH